MLRRSVSHPPVFSSKSCQREGFFVLDSSSTGQPWVKPGNDVEASEREAESQAGAYLFLNFAGRFSTKAAMPSFWSSVANSAWNTRRSKRTPSAKVVSNARLTLSLAA